MLAADPRRCRQIEWADVVGFSYGGAVAQQFAYDHPARVRRLVLAATFCGVGAVPGSQAAMMSLATPLRYYSPSYYNRTAADDVGRRDRPRFDGAALDDRRRPPPSAVFGRLHDAADGHHGLVQPQFPPRTSRTRRWSSAATTTRWCRWPTARCWPPDSARTARGGGARRPPAAVGRRQERVAANPAVPELGDHRPHRAPSHQPAAVAGRAAAAAAAAQSAGLSALTRAYDGPVRARTAAKPRRRPRARPRPIARHQVVGRGLPPEVAGQTRQPPPLRVRDHGCPPVRAA